MTRILRTELQLDRLLKKLYEIELFLLQPELRLNVINIPGYIQTLKRTACILRELCSGTAQNDEEVGIITNLLDTRFEDNHMYAL